MSESDRILATAGEWSQRGIEFAMATVVGVRGSTYRGLAARQLLAADGTGAGTVSGGCLDQDLRLVADEVIATGTARIVEFDLTADDEAVWGWGIGCNGATNLLVETAATAGELVAALQGARRPLVIVHHLDEARLGQRHVVGPDDNGPYAEIARRALEDGGNHLLQTGDDTVMVEVLGAARRLIVCGAGHDAAPLVRLAGELGFEPVVVDDRRTFLSSERFPGAAQFLHAAPSDLATTVDLDTTDSIVIMSHNYLRDLDYLRAALGRGVGYIGVLGPGERLRRLLDDLATDGVQPSPTDLAALHGPAGLDIGSEGPLEIAWAVLAEIMAVRRRAGGGFLRDRKGPRPVRHYDPAK